MAIVAIATVLLFTVGLFLTKSARAAGADSPVAEHVITVHDDGEQQGFYSDATTLREALKKAGIRLDPRDRTEPELDTQLDADSYDVNIYRARPVTIRDGAGDIKVISAYRTGKQIAKEAGIALRDEDIVKLTPSTDVMQDGAVEVMTIQRATAVTFDFYGKVTTAYTQADTVGGMLRARGVSIGASDKLTPDQDAPITDGMNVRIWREGKQTVTQEEDVAFETQQVKDADKDRSFKEIKTPGVPGRRVVTYEIIVQNGVEVSRKEINSDLTKQPVAQVEVIGAKVVVVNGLTKAKGVVTSTDSNGVAHRETYYDLPMRVVMGNCGAGGVYSVREDGVKVDKDGYIIIAANLAKYPRCSLVETSLGTGKVYDTGGFVARHPDGFDLATDWSNNDGI